MGTTPSRRSRRAVSDTVDARRRACALAGPARSDHAGARARRRIPWRVRSEGRRRHRSRRIRTRTSGPTGHHVPSGKAGLELPVPSRPRPEQDPLCRSLPLPLPSLASPAMLPFSAGIVSQGADGTSKSRRASDDSFHRFLTSPASSRFFPPSLCWLGMPTLCRMSVFPQSQIVEMFKSQLVSSGPGRSAREDENVTTSDTSNLSQLLKYGHHGAKAGFTVSKQRSEDGSGD